MIKAIIPDDSFKDMKIPTDQPIARGHDLVNSWVTTIADTEDAITALLLEVKRFQIRHNDSHVNLVVSNLEVGGHRVQRA